MTIIEDLQKIEQERNVAHIAIENLKTESKILAFFEEYVNWLKTGDMQGKDPRRVAYFNLRWILNDYITDGKQPFAFFSKVLDRLDPDC